MVAAPLRYLGEVPQLARDFLGDPAETFGWLQERVARRRDRHRPPCPYKVDLDWERRLHEMLGVQWPCDAAAEFWALWPQVMTPFRDKGVRIGRGAFAGWGDGEPGLARSVWCLTRHLRPINVIETGVARGFTSRFILEAMDRNNAGHLWSIDVPPPHNPELHEQIGAAVDQGLRHRWSYIAGSSRRRLPKLVSDLRHIDLFVHDSSHTERNVRFELDNAWAVLRPGGALVADDIDFNWGFHSFTQTFSGHQALVCHGEPLEPDPPRFDGKGLFGIIRKAV